MRRAFTWALVAVLAAESPLFRVESARAAAGGESVASQIAEFSQQIGAAQQTLSEKLNQLEEELQAQQITSDDKLRATLAALREEYESEGNLLDGESQLDGLSRGQSRQIANEMHALDLDYRARVAAARQDAKNQAKNQDSPFSDQRFEAIARPTNSPWTPPPPPPPSTNTQDGDKDDHPIPEYVAFGVLGAGLMGGLVALVGTEKKSQVSP